MTWDYLQFIYGETKQLFLIKNAAYFNEDCFSLAELPDKSKGKGHRRTYLHELSKINSGLDFTSYLPRQSVMKNMEQLSLFVPEKLVRDELKSVQSNFNEFHILTYEIDNAFQIAKIMHYLPNPEDNIAYRVEDLSAHIKGAELTDEEREVLAPEQDGDIIDPVEFDIGIFEAEDEESN